MTKEKRQEIKETFKSLGEMLLQTDSVEVVTSSKFIELLAKAKTFLSELRLVEFMDTPVNDLRNEMENAIVLIEACMGLVGDKKKVEALQEFLCKAQRCLRIVNSYLKGW